MLEKSLLLLQQVLVDTRAKTGSMQGKMANRLARMVNTLEKTGNRLAKMGNSLVNLVSMPENLAKHSTGRMDMLERPASKKARHSSSWVIEVGHPENEPSKTPVILARLVKTNR